MPKERAVLQQDSLCGDYTVRIELPPFEPDDTMDEVGWERLRQMKLHGFESAIVELFSLMRGSNLFSVTVSRKEKA